jgi:hypothetical protein
VTAATPRQRRSSIRLALTVIPPSQQLFSHQSGTNDAGANTVTGSLPVARASFE